MKRKEKSLQELTKEEEKIQRKLKTAKQNLRILQSREKEQKRKDRVHRICNHGGLLEYYLPPDQFTDQQIATILKILFHRPETKEIMDSFRGGAERESSLR